MTGQVAKAAEGQVMESELIAEAPDEFLDPILSILMKEPIRLPSSGKVVDRSTIAKHFLSDASDPFNRQPLTMDMLEPQKLLQTQIHNWTMEQTTKREAGKIMLKMIKWLRRNKVMPLILLLMRKVL